jgi:acyl-CoA reductase-like NAD-dependent aldehyde dehydrogenase
MLTPSEAQSVIQKANLAQKQWHQVPLTQKMEIIRIFLKEFTAMTENVSKELAELIGRPLQHCRNEVKTMVTRSEYLLSIAQEALKDTEFTDQPGFTRFIRKVPLGTIFVIAPWNYPYLTAINGIIPSLLAGNSIILKHSPWTFACGDRLQSAFEKAGLPPNVFQNIRIDHDVAKIFLSSPNIHHVQFTGSVRGGKEVMRAVEDRLISKLNIH